MPTRPGSDLVPVRRATKERLARLKGDMTYDALLTRLLDAAESPPAALIEPRPRLPEEQLALAEMARRRWQLAVESGQLEERAPRLIVYRTGRKERMPCEARRSRLA